MNTKFEWRDMLRFDKMIAPDFLTVLYYVHVSLVSLFWLATISDGMSDRGYSRTFGFDGGKLVMIGLVGFIVSPFLIRVAYEILIVIFQIYSRLTNIDQSLRGPNVPTSTVLNRSPATGWVGPSQESVVDLPSGLPGTIHGNDTGPSVQRTPVTDSAPTGISSPSAGLRDFWDLPGSQAHGNPGGVTPSIDLGDVKSKMPNWPAVIAAVLVMYATISPYAQIGLDVPIIGSMMGKSYAIKDGSLGMLTVFASISMLVALAGGTKWNIFIISYAATFLTTLVALLSDGSVFSDVSKVKSGVAQAGAGISSGLGQFIPQAGNIGNQIAANAPGASQFLSLTFYLLILSMVFLLYWGFSGRYQEKGLLKYVS